MFYRALWHNNNLTSSVWNEYNNSYNKDYLYIKSKYSLISTGTERLIACGKVPTNCYSHMHVPYMQGSFSLPIKYGYNLIGETQDNQQIVHLMHPHQDQCRVRPSSINFLPKSIAPRKATLFGTMETIINAIWDAQIDEAYSDKILVVGAGLIGMTLALTLQNVLQKEVYIHEIHPFRKEWAQSHGLPLHQSGQYPVCVHTTSSGVGLQFAIDRLSFEGTVIEMSWYGNKPVSLNLGSSFHYNRKKIVSSQVSKIPGHMKNEWNYEKRKKLAWEFLEHKCFDHLITREIPFEQSSEFFEQLRNGENDFIGCIIKY